MGIALLFCFKDWISANRVPYTSRLKSCFCILLIAATEWKLGAVQSYSKSDDFHLLEFPCKIEEGESISQNDLLLINKEKVLKVEDCVSFDFAGPATMMYLY